MKNNKKLTLVPLILMIFTSVFGFANMPRAYYLMGYAAIPAYIIGALFFFIPYALMMAEYGSAFKNESGGMYSWMEKTVGGKYAFVGTFMWYTSYLVWMVSVSSSIWIPLSNAIFGSDMTSSWSLFGLNSVQTLGILGIIWILFVNFVSTKGLDKISKITSVGGSAITVLNVVLLVGGVLVAILNGGFSQPITDVTQTLIQSPNPAYQSVISSTSFLTFAIFAFGGLEVLGALVDQTENSEKTFPKGLLISALIISLGYALGIFAIGMFTNWDLVLSGANVNLGNVTYIIISNLGLELGLALGLSQSVAMTIGTTFARFVGLSMFLALSGAFFTLSYSPLKTLIVGSPKKVWPGKLAELKNGIPVNAMYVQAIIVVVMILFVAFGGSNASEFFSILTLMTNVAMTIPYLFLAACFPIFKKKQLAGKLPKAYVAYKSFPIALVTSIIVTIVVAFANVFTIIEPVISSPADGLSTTLTMIGGPLLFAIVGYGLYTLYERKNK